MAYPEGRKAVHPRLRIRGVRAAFTKRKGHAGISNGKWVGHGLRPAMRQARQSISQQSLTTYQCLLQQVLVDVRQFEGEAEASKLDAPVLIQQDVGGFEVAEDDRAGMQVLQ